jgi:hypothetical protein
VAVSVSVGVGGWDGESVTVWLLDGVEVVVAVSVRVGVRTWEGVGLAVLVLVGVGESVAVCRPLWVATGRQTATIIE